MNISQRIREIREHRGLKQFHVAHEMQISQQAYSTLERKPVSHKIGTLKRFCEVVKVDLPFLLATEIPVTDENMNLLDMQNYALIMDSYKKLKSKSDVYESLILKNNEHYKAAPLPSDAINTKFEAGSMAGAW